VKKLLALSLVVILVVVFSSMALGADMEWWEKAAEPYRGVTLKVIGQSTAPSIVLRDIAAPEFEKVTGIKVDFEVQPWEVEYEKFIRDVTGNTGIYDAAYIEQDAIYAFMQQKWLTDLTELMEKNPQITDPDLDVNDFTKFIEYFKDSNGHIFGFPFEAFLKMYIYRTDLFNDPEAKEAFKAEYGKDLKPADTWEEYEQNAKFFTEWGKKKGIELYGHTAQAKTGYPAVAYEIVESIWPAMGIYNWGINLEKWRATVENGGQVNSDKAKAALRWYVDMLKYAPPDVKTYTWDEESSSVAAGKVAQGLVYCENLAPLICNPEKSKVAGKVAVTKPPTTPEALADAKAGKGYIGYYDGASYSIPYCSKNKEAAWLFIQWVTRKGWDLEYTRLASRVVRKSTLESPEIKDMDIAQGGYFTAFKEYESLFSGAAPLPMHLVIIDIYMNWISKAVAGEATPEEALDGLAKEIDEAMVKLGY